MRRLGRLRLDLLATLVRDLTRVTRPVGHHSDRTRFALVKGEAKDTSKIKCKSCKKNAEKYGWCDACKVGLVGNVAFKDKDDFKKASESHDVLLAAVKAADKCETCAIAMVTDGKCDACKISYKGDKKVKAEGP